MDWGIWSLNTGLAMTNFTFIVFLVLAFIFGVLVAVACNNNNTQNNKPNTSDYSKYYQPKEEDNMTEEDVTRIYNEKTFH